LNGASYVKTGDVWIKYADSDSNDENLPVDVDTYTSQFEADENTPENSLKDTYKNLGKEACGDLECFKYQILDSAQSEAQTFIWFDTKEYKLRKIESTDAGGITVNMA